jgi:signal transduction histidine kinase
VAEIMAAITTAVHQRQENSAAPIDDRARSVLGRRLLELLRAEIVLDWPSHGLPAAQMAPFLIAIERVREEIEAASPPASLELLIEVAHDFQSPLTSILFLADTMQRGQSGPLSELQRWQLGLIYGAALGLSSLTSDVIELAQGNERLLEKEPVPVSVRAIFDSLEDLVRPIAEERRLTARFVPPAADHRLGHPLALTRVLLNLMTNALKFTDQGFVEIEARDIGPSRIQFSVRDSGRGIEPEVLHRLYQPFQPGTTPRGYGFSGTGLGLAICRRLVQAMGSDLEVETFPGKGTRFFFDLFLPQSQVPDATRETAYVRNILRRGPRERRKGRDRRVAAEGPQSTERRSGGDRRGVLSVTPD